MLSKALIKCGDENELMATPKKKLDFQTLSLFLTLAILTGFFVFGLKWVLLTPDARVPAATVEGTANATK
jgi:hypothetical protein